MRFLRSLAVAAACLCAAPAIAARPATQYTFRDLGTLGPFGAQAQAINNRGDIVGLSNTGNAIHAFIWQDGVLRDIGTPPDTGSSELHAINDHGLAAGVADGRIYLWKDGEWTRLPLNFGRVTDINRSGSIVGSQLQFNPTGDEAFLLRDGVLFILPTLGSVFVEAHALNDKDVVVGSSVTASGDRHAFRYENGVITDLGTLGGTFSIARDINNQGVIVGEAADASFRNRAFMYAGGGMRPIPCTLPGFGSAASAINDRGTIVGTFAESTSVGNRGFVCEDGRLTVLDQIPAVRGTGWIQLIPLDINERGWIAGIMRSASAFTFHAFVLIPH